MMPEVHRKEEEGQGVWQIDWLRCDAVFGTAEAVGEVNFVMFEIVDQCEVTAGLRPALALYCETSGLDNKSPTLQGSVLCRVPYEGGPSWLKVSGERERPAEDATAQRDTGTLTVSGGEKN
ncbi:unnamed protein product [Pleuronectes platessa]|uniref:Uncharacterized protein n=1 Tax=Pleuronectes platessa TaxID=8262 RepID=A0A9N7Y9A4_PLEPL|nr:unnamed protein product [Pleuronectes platessa]